MREKTFLVKLRGGAAQSVTAAYFEVHSEHVIFLSAEGELSAMFMLAIVEAFTDVLPEPSRRNGATATPRRVKRKAAKRVVSQS